MARLAALCAALLGSALGQQSQAEIELLEQADRVVETFCPVDFAPLNYDNARARLEVSAGENNPIYQTVLEADIGNGFSTNVLLERLEENLNVSFIVGRAFAFVLLLILLIVWFGGCWCFLIPCCMRCCCRCCEVHHQLGKRWCFHLFLWVLFGILAIGSLVTQGLSFWAYDNIDQGVQGTACYSAKLVRDVVNGNPDLNFAGLLPATDTLEEVAGVLEPTSSAMLQISSLLNLTEDLKKAVNLNFAILNMLIDLIDDPQNVAPSGSMHKCQICSPLADTARPLLDSMEDSVAVALFEARQQVEEQLSGPQLAALRASLRSTVAPLEQIKATVVDKIGFFLSTAEGGFHKIMEYIRGDFWTGNGGYLFPAILVLFLICVLLVIHGIFSLGVFACCGGREHDPCCVRYSAGYSLCSSYCYTMLLLLLGGIMVILSTVSSGVCLVMIDFDREVGEKLMVSLGIGSEELDDVLDMALNVTDQCMSLKADPNGNMDLTQLIRIPAVNPSYPGEMSTPRQEVVNLALKPIEAAFAQLDSLETMIPSVSDLPQVNEMLTIISQINMKTLIWADPQQIVESSRYRAMNPAYYLTTLDCPNNRAPDILPPPLAGMILPGIDAMATDGFHVLDLDEVGQVGERFQTILPGVPDQIEVPGLVGDMASPVWSCPGGFSSGTCGTAPSSNLLTETACRAGKAFLEERKLPLLSDRVFVCKYFQTPGAPWGTACDISNHGFNNTPCIYANGSLETFNKPCTLDEFSQQISDFQQTIRSGLDFLDATVEGVVDHIKETLRAVVNENVVDPVMGLLNSLDCSFMRSFWSGLTSSLCLRSVGGFHIMSVSYLMAGIFSLLCAFVMYIPWRVSRDNEDIWETTPHPIEAVTEPEAAAAEPAPAPAPAAPVVAAETAPHVPVPGAPLPREGCAARLCGAWSLSL